MCISFQIPNVFMLSLIFFFSFNQDFSPLYISLISIGEESGTLAQVFGHLSIYLKAKKNMRRKIIQALLYPCLVLFTAVAVVIILTVLLI